MKRLLFFSVMLFAALAAQGQRFEWAKGYDSGYEDAYIKGTVTDSLGNLYILGQIHYDSDWGNEWLMPYLTTINTMVLVAKISPDGEMVWRKMFGKTTNPIFAQDIRALGDTGFAVMLNDSYSGNPNGNTWYWGDTIYTNIYHPLVSPYDTPGRRFWDGVLTDYVAFDFDGNITEQHALEIGYVDTDGNDYLYRASHPDSLPFHYMQNMNLITFDVDNDGNFYLSFLPNTVQGGTMFEYNGTICTLSYWVDHRLVGKGYFDNNINNINHILTKFSPHFDSVLASRYIVQSNPNEDFNLRWNQVKIRQDKSTNYLWVILNLNHAANHFQNNMVIDSTQNMVVHGSWGSWNKGFVVVYDTLLCPINVIELRDSSFNTSTSYANSRLYDIDFDYDSNLVAISGNSGIGDGVFLYENRTLPLSDKSFVLLLDKDNYTLKTINTVPATGQSGLVGNTHYGNLVLKSNRIFYQDKYYTGISLPSGNYPVQGSATYLGLALLVWDYQGNLIDGREYHTYSQKHNPGPIALVDSTLYLVNQLCANATFVNQTFYASNSYMACIAKYVDTTFMTVYRPPVGGISPGAEGVDYSFYPNPVENLLHVNLEGENILAASAISVLGIKDNLEVVGDAVDVSHLQPGIYIMELATMRNTHHFKFIKQ